MTAQSRPIFVFAHRCNTISDVNKALEYGANAIECDFAKKSDGTIVVTHDLGIQDALSAESDAVEYLKKAGQIATENKSIAIWCLDIKESMQSDDLIRLHKLINQYLPADLYKLYTLYGTDGEQKYTSEFLSLLSDREGINYEGDPAKQGLDFGINRALRWRDKHQVQNFFYSAGIDPSAQVALDVVEETWKTVKNIAQIDNHGTVSNKVYRLMNDAMGMRGMHGNFGTYIWTYNHLDSAVKALNTYELDAVMGNMSSLVQLSSDTAFSRLAKRIIAGEWPELRLGTREDILSLRQRQGLIASREGDASFGEKLYLRSAYNGLFFGSAVKDSDWYPRLAHKPISLLIKNADGETGVPVRDGDSIIIETTEDIGAMRLGAFSGHALYYEKPNWPDKQTWIIRKVNEENQVINEAAADDNDSMEVQFGDCFILENRHYSDQFLEPTYYTSRHECYYLTTRENQDIDGMRVWTFC